MKLGNTQKKILLKLAGNKTSYREDLARSVGISKPALTMAVKSLSEEGLVLEKAEANGKVGRNRSVLSLSPSVGEFLSIDVKPSSYTVLLSSFDLAVLKEEKFLDGPSFLKALPSYLSGNILSAGITYRGERAEFERNPVNREMLDMLLGKGIPVSDKNNVDALAALYRTLRPEEKSFLLIKYGPGLGSSVYVRGEEAEDREGGRSEIGHVYLSDGRRLEDVLSFQNLFGEELSEEEGSKRLLENPSLYEKVLFYLALALADADAFLCLDSIVLSGMLLSKEGVRRDLLKKISSFNGAFRQEKAVLYPDYAEQNRLKGIFSAFAEYLKTL